MTDQHPPASLTLESRLAGLAAFLPVFEQEGFKFGEWAGGNRLECGAIQMPWYKLSDEAMRFYEAVYNLEWVVAFNWGKWSETDESRYFFDNPGRIEHATVEQIEKLITVCIRSDRFVEGALEGAFEDGYLTAIVRRADSLLKSGVIELPE